MSPGRDPAVVETRIARALRTVGVDNAVVGVGREGERDAAAAVGRDPGRGSLTLDDRIGADRPMPRRLVGPEQRPQVGQLPTAVRSPVATIEDEDNRTLAALRRHGVAAPVLIGQREIGGNVADAQPRPGRRGRGDRSGRGRRDCDKQEPEQASDRRALPHREGGPGRMRKVSAPPRGTIPGPSVNSTHRVTHARPGVSRARSGKPARGTRSRRHRA